MIITHIAVEAVGRFRTRHVVRGLGPGLNVLCAPNEAGKSTIFRAVQACLFARHDSNAKDTRALGCNGAQLPACVEVGFRHAGADYRIEKSFLRQPASRLENGGCLIADGRAADEALWSLLDLSPGARPFESSAFGLLWVRQGQSFEPARPGEEAHALLSRAIEAEVGQVLGGERGERVMRRVLAQLAAEETRTGQPKAGGTWKAAVEQVAAARRALDEVQATLTTLEADRHALADKLRERDQVADAGAFAQMQADLAAAQRQREAAVELDQAAERAETEAARRELAHERARDSHRRLVALDQRIVASRAQIAKIERQASAQEATVNAHAASLATRETALAGLASRLASAERAAELARASERAAKTGERVRDLAARLDQARQLGERISRSQQALAAVAVAPDALRRLEQAAQEFDSAQARCAARAPRVAIRLGPAGTGRVRCGDEAIEGQREFSAVAPLRIDVADIAAIEVTPAAAPELAHDLPRARASLDQELATLGVASLGQARERRAKADDVATELRGLAAELAMIAPGAEGVDGILLLERALSEAQARLAEGAGNAPLADPETLRQQRHTAEQACDALRREHNEQQAALLAARSAAAAEDGRLEAVRGARTAAHDRLAADLALGPDGERPDRLVALAAEAAQSCALFEQARAEALRLRAAVPGDEHRASLAARIKRLTQAIASRQDRLQSVERDIAGLQGRVASRGGDGLGERASELAEAVGIAEKELARIERRLTALRLLRDTIETCRRAARDAFLAPVKQAMAPYLQTLFPGGEAELDERFSIGGVQRSGSEAEPFESLSDGTREQIAIMVRLAFGRLLAERGQPIPVVLDDALVFSDDERIERMFDVLMQAAEKQQVIVLTCRSRAFRSCGGRPLAIEPDAAFQEEFRLPMRFAGNG